MPTEYILVTCTQKNLSVFSKGKIFKCIKNLYLNLSAELQTK